MPLGRQTTQNRQMTLVHRQEKVVLAKMLPCKSRGAKGRKIVAPQLRVMDRAGIGRRPDVIAVRTATTYRNLKAMGCSLVAEHGFGGWRATDIPRANKEDMHGNYLYHSPMLTRNGSIVILTGAGISRDSGLATFRDLDGIWAKVRIEDVATPEAFAKNPARVHEFYNARRQALLCDAVQINPAHTALARLEQAWPGDVLLVTQNIDDLHERAGSTRLIHMHGELLKARCRTCHAVSPWPHDMDENSPCPACGAKLLRVHVVWFGEMPFDMARITKALRRCDLFLSIGTSGNVYPAAGFVREALGKTVEINLEPSEGARLFDEAVYGPASETVPVYVEKLLRENGCR